MSIASVKLRKAALAPARRSIIIRTSRSERGRPVEFPHDENIALAKLIQSRRSSGRFHRDELRQLVSRYGLSCPRVFGSVLCGMDTDDSDLDLLVNPGRSTSLLTIAGLKIDAEKLLGVPVSVLTPNGLPPKFCNEVLQQAQPL